MYPRVYDFMFVKAWLVSAFVHCKSDLVEALGMLFSGTCILNALIRCIVLSDRWWGRNSVFFFFSRV